MMKSVGLILMVAGCIIAAAGISAAFSAAICGPAPETTYIESASMSGQTQGSFSLFGGTISEEQYYFYYIKEKGGLMLEKSEASRTVIVEGADKPRIITHPCQTNKLYVPENTVILDYSVAQPGVKQ